MREARPAYTLSHDGHGSHFAAPGQERMWSWGFVWDGAGRLADRLDPRGVRAATTYRPEGWVDDVAYSRMYDALGNPQQINLPEGITLPRYDARSQVTLATYQVSGTNEEFRYL